VCTTNNDLTNPAISLTAIICAWDKYRDQSSPPLHSGARRSSTRGVCCCCGGILAGRPRRCGEGKRAAPHKRGRSRFPSGSGVRRSAPGPTNELFSHKVLAVPEDLIKTSVLFGPYPFLMAFFHHVVPRFSVRFPPLRLAWRAHRFCWHGLILPPRLASFLPLPRFFLSFPIPMSTHYLARNSCAPSSVPGRRDRCADPQFPPGCGDLRRRVPAAEGNSSVWNWKTIRRSWFSRT